MKNYGKDYKELWSIASKVICQCGPNFLHTDEFGTNVTQEDIRIASDSEFVVWDEGGASPTKEFNFWDSRFNK